MKKNCILIFLILTLLAIHQSCTKEEGEGGTSSISGRVYVVNYYSYPIAIKDTCYAQEEDVYIIYGDDKVYSDRFETHYDGTYRFQYLRKGKYTVFAYSDSTGSSQDIPVIKKVEITDNNQEVEVEDMYIINRD